MELEKLAQQEIRLVEQIAHAQYPIDLSKYRLKHEKIASGAISFANSPYSLLKVSKSGLILAVMFKPDASTTPVAAPDLNIVVDGVNLFEDFHLYDGKGIEVEYLQQRGLTAVHHFLPYVAQYDTTSNVYVAVWAPNPPVRFNTGFELYAVGTQDPITCDCEVWWLEGREEGGLASKVR